MSILQYLHFDQPTQEQVKVLMALEEFVALDIADDFFILTGSAGTGKTSLISALVGYLNEMNLSYHIAAPTGRAARIIGRKTQTYSTTIHSLIYNVEHDDNGFDVYFTLKKNLDQAAKIYIIDEASMVPSQIQDKSQFHTANSLLFDLVSFVKSGNVNNKLIFIGDQYQLPPVFEQESFALNPSYLATTFNFSGTLHVLTEVKRQEDGSYIIREATQLRDAIDRGDTYDSNKVPSSGNIYTSSKQYTRDLHEHGPEHAVSIAMSNKQARYFNDLVRKERFGYYKKTLEVGDLLLVMRNWERNGQQLFNGDQVLVEDIDWGIQEEVAGLHFTTIRVKLLFKDGEPTYIEDYILLDHLIRPDGKISADEERNLVADRMAKNGIYRETRYPGDDKYVGAMRMTYGYAITAHKAQGGEWKKVYVNTFYMPSLKWTYTAFTRAQEELRKF